MQVIDLTTSEIRVMFALILSKFKINIHLRLAYGQKCYCPNIITTIISRTGNTVTFKMQEQHLSRILWATLLLPKCKNNTHLGFGQYCYYPYVRITLIFHMGKCKNNIYFAYGQFCSGSYARTTLILHMGDTITAQMQKNSTLILHMDNTVTALIQEQKLNRIGEI